MMAQNGLIVCGAEEVFILDSDLIKNEVRKSWSWRAKDSPEIPIEGRESFRSTDDCKPVGENILITSSSGGVALIRRGNKSCLFYTNAKNAHSACLLPKKRIAVASSFGGDELLVYRIEKPNGSPALPIAKIPLRGAHGVIWDHETQRLWALGSDDLLQIKLVQNRTSLELKTNKKFKLPTPGGHELSRTGKPNNFFVTTDHHVYRFDTTEGKFSPDPDLADEPKVKSISVNPQTGQIVYHQASPENWWSDTIRFVGGKEAIKLPGQRLYKIRWDSKLE
ncbi:MAG: DUF6528 family protein [Planctomycetota bacterium]